MLNALEDINWNILLRRIKEGDCTPFLGAGVNHGILPLGADIAKELAEKYKYPFKDCNDLLRVSQFLAVTQDPKFPKEEILEMLKDHLEQWEKTVTLPDFFKAPDEPLSILADLPIPIYMTTNYDNLLFRALEARQKEPKRELCRWYENFRRIPSVFDPSEVFEPTSANPVVFHLHGYGEVKESLVLTEDDYINFLINISKQQDLLPPRIQQAIADTSLIFIGYRFADWNFRVLFQGIVRSVESSNRPLSVAVQLLPEDTDENTQRKQQVYLAKYFSNIERHIHVYWGSAKEFAVELRERWDKFDK